MGVKYDENKLLGNILLDDFPEAIQQVLAVATFGARKYSRAGWKTVPNARERYQDALARHQLAIALGETVDVESGLPHRAHLAWNALALLQLEFPVVPLPEITTTSMSSYDPLSDAQRLYKLVNGANADVGMATEHILAALIWKFS